MRAIFIVFTAAMTIILGFFILTSGIKIIEERMKTQAEIIKQ